MAPVDLHVALATTQQRDSASAADCNDDYEPSLSLIGRGRELFRIVDTYEAMAINAGWLRGGVGTCS